MTNGTVRVDHENDSENRNDDIQDSNVVVEWTLSFRPFDHGHGGEGPVSVPRYRLAVVAAAARLLLVVVGHSRRDPEKHFH